MRASPFRLATESGALQLLEALLSRVPRLPLVQPPCDAPRSSPGEPGRRLRASVRALSMKGAMRDPAATALAPAAGAALTSVHAGPVNHVAQNVVVATLHDAPLGIDERPEISLDIELHPHRMRGLDQLARAFEAIMRDFEEGTRQRIRVRSGGTVNRATIMGNTVAVTAVGISWASGSIPTLGILIVGNTFNVTTPFSGFTRSDSRVNSKANVGPSGLLTETALVP